MSWPSYGILLLQLVLLSGLLAGGNSRHWLLSLGLPPLLAGLNYLRLGDPLRALSAFIIVALLVGLALLTAPLLGPARSPPAAAAPGPQRWRSLAPAPAAAADLRPAAGLVDGAAADHHSGPAAGSHRGGPGLWPAESAAAAAHSAAGRPAAGPGFQRPFCCCRRPGPCCWV